MLVHILFVNSQALAVEPMPPNGSKTLPPFLVKNNISCSISWNEYGAGCNFSIWASLWLLPNPFWYIKLFVHGIHSVPFKSFNLFLGSTSLGASTSWFSKYLFISLSYNLLAPFSLYVSVNSFLSIILVNLARLIFNFLHTSATDISSSFTTLTSHHKSSHIMFNYIIFLYNPVVFWTI